MMLSRKSILLIGTSLAACVTAASMVVAIMSGPAVGRGTRLAAGTQGDCRSATWPGDPANCPQAPAAGDRRPANPDAQRGGAS